MVSLSVAVVLSVTYVPTKIIFLVAAGVVTLQGTNERTTISQPI